MPQSRRILLVEDHQDTRDLITLVLEDEDYLVTTDITLAGALKSAATNEFDLYVLDTDLPDGSGFDLCERIRMFDPVTPILFYSGAAYDADKLKAIRAGAQGYLVKPCSFAELLRAVASLIGRVPSSQHIRKARDLVA